ncbi:hypothetical protein OBBRIDRAFT_892032 [Obba rivulosa]|uniref:tRNA ligase n=1 Tax=Obba rivulosa TaxID=1052685 RepID=A0A8E2AGF7_9APHY|nr:hypothetical protein OBBRIDRAFT_892032 [Obba rivulosa]
MAAAALEDELSGRLKNVSLNDEKQSPEALKKSTPQDRTNEEDSSLVEELYKLSKKSPKLVRSSVYSAPADPSMSIRSWKMNEFKYHDVPSPFPTLARGLFTRDVETESGETKHRIVARGYDKFFNIGEVPWTTWASLEANTRAPYTLTLKSNGCIIFIAALTPEKLLVTSKHSLGPASGEGVRSHAQVGEEWLRKLLAKKGRTEAQLASVLWGKNWTAVAELCDDSFEEHVLPYAPDQTGLHLHGLNECTKAFKTMDQSTVDAFAEEWGFIKTPSTVLKTVPEVKAFTEAVGKSGKWNGEALEGFVVRTHVADPAAAQSSARAPPYAPGSSFFFKVKFDEPYMMYRDWREVTKTLLSKGPSEANVPKSKLRRPETKAYVRWVIDEIKRDRAQFAEFGKGKGIIRTRERFLEWLETEQGSKAMQGTSEISEEEGLQRRDGKKFGKTIIVPVAIPGVGKTSVAVALSHLFGFGHTQSDDVHVKKSAPVFIKNVVELLKKHDVVIADKNNHLKLHRQQLRDAVKDFDPPVRLMALNWSLDKPMAAIHRICSDRVTQRGENHQTLRADTLAKTHEDVLWLFLRGTQELTDAEVDVSVEMDLEENLEDALARAVDACVRILGVPRPSAERVGEALAIARGYAPKTKKPDDPKKKAPPKARYFGILAEVDLQDVLGRRVAEPDASAESKAFFKKLEGGKRIAKRPHVTIVHSKSLPAEQELWDRCMGLHSLAVPPLLRFRLSRLVWNDRVMAAVVSDLAVCNEEEDVDGKAQDFVLKLSQEVKERLHITVGTKDDSVPPVEAKDLVLEWKKQGDTSEIQSVELKDVWVKGRVKGLM